MPCGLAGDEFLGASADGGWAAFVVLVLEGVAWLCSCRTSLAAGALLLVGELNVIVNHSERAGALGSILSRRRPRF